MLGAAVVLRVVGEINRRLVVHVDGRRAGRGKSELFKELPIVGRRFGGFGGGHNLRLAVGESDRGLLRGGPLDGAALPLDSVARCRASGGPVRVGEGVKLPWTGLVAKSEVSRVMEVCENAVGFAE